MENGRGYLVLRDKKHTKKVNTAVYGECNYLQVLNENGQKRAEMFDGDLFGIV